MPTCLCIIVLDVLGHGTARIYVYLVYVDIIRVSHGATVSMTCPPVLTTASLRRLLVFLLGATLIAWNSSALVMELQPP